MKITFYGQNSLHSEVSEKHVLVDPLISGSPLAKDSVDINSLKAVYILLTHAHQDHVLDAEAIAQNTVANSVSNYEIAMHHQAKDLTVHPMNYSVTWSFEFARVEDVSVFHTSTFTDGGDGGVPRGFVIEGEYKNIYIASDFLEWDKAHGMHYNTFGYIEIDHDEAKKKCCGVGKNLMLIEIGASIEL